MKIRILPLFALPLLAACELATGPDADPRPGIIQSPYLQAPVVVAPATVQAGEPFQVTVRTLGFSGCWVEARTTVTSEPGAATVRVYDRTVGEVCTAALKTIDHTAGLRFDAPGTARIVVEGRGDPSLGETGVVTIERTVTVQ